MKKMITLLAAVSLMASPFAFAENESPANSNDVLHSIPAHETAGSEQPMTVADASNTQAMPAMDNTAKPAKAKSTKHHKKSYCKTHHCKKHSCKSKHKKHTAKTPVAQPEQTVAPTAGTN